MHIKKVTLIVFYLLSISLCSCNESDRQEPLQGSIENPYFIVEEASGAKYMTRFGFDGESDLPAEVNLSITKVHDFQDGSLYEMKIGYEKEFSGRDYYDWDRLQLGYFYVQEDQITMFRGPDLNDLVDGKEPDLTKGTIVCRSNEKKDELGEDVNGWHEYILVDGSRCEYRGYSTFTETGYYETFVWETGLGLVNYRSGFGAERDHIELTRITENEDADENQYFFPINLESMEVLCEMNILHAFKGTATLEIEKLSDTKLDRYYELRLSDLEGKCDSHSDFNHPDCEYSGSFSIGYLYVDRDLIYLMSNSEEYREIFRKTDVFPPDEDLIYRLVCSEDGFEDTYGTGEGINKDYHNFIHAVDDEMRYNLWPETSGTQEYMYIFWKKGEGIIFYANWAGNFKGYIAFYDESYAYKSNINLHLVE